MDELWIEKTPDELYEYFYRSQSPLSLGIKRKPASEVYPTITYLLNPFLWGSKVPVTETDEEIYKKNALKEIQRKKSDVIRKQYANTYRNLTNTISNLKANQADFVLSDRVKNSEYYNVSLLEYAYYKLYLEIVTKKQQFEIAVSDNNVQRFPMSVSFDMDGITGILPTHAFKIKFDSFPMQYNVNYDEILFVVNSLTHTFQGNEWSTSIGGLMYINPSKITKTNITNRKEQKEKQLRALKKVFINEINQLVDEDSKIKEDIRKKLNIDNW